MRQRHEPTYERIREGTKGQVTRSGLQAQLAPLHPLPQVLLLQLYEALPELIRGVGPLEELAHVFYVPAVGQNELPAVFEVYVLESAGREHHDVPGVFQPALLAQKG